MERLKIKCENTHTRNLIKDYIRNDNNIKIEINTIHNEITVTGTEEVIDKIYDKVDNALCIWKDLKAAMYW